jgi:hypothetical protein
MKNELTLVFDHESVDRDLAWESIASQLQEQGLAEAAYEIADELVDFQEIGSLLKQRGKQHFGIKGVLLEFDLTVVGTYRHDAIRITGASGSDWDGWVKDLKKVGRFVQALLVDREYDFWQNAEDPLQYQTRGKSCEGLPMKSNGLPFPLEQQVIDTSKNPGRRVFREGFIEAIGSPMWLSDRFWELTGANKNAIPNDRVMIDDKDGITKVWIDEAITEHTDQEIQEALRKSLFPECAVG